MRKIKIHFSVKRKASADKAIIGKIVSVGIHFVEQKNVRKGLVRLVSLKDDNLRRLKNNQLVITLDGLGVIKDLDLKRDEQNNIIQPLGVNVRVRNLNKNKVFYNLNNLKVIDLIDNKTGDRYQAIDSDYPYLLIDDLPVNFIVDSSNRAMLSIDSRKKLEGVKMFSKKTNGIKLLNNLNEKGLWIPTGQ